MASPTPSQQPPGSAPQAVLPLEVDAEGRRLWHSGTLIYTSAGLIALFFWLLLGDFAFAMRERSAHAVVQLALKKYGATSTLQSWVLVIMPNAVALILQPIIAYKSDRHRSKWGRRIPFLLWTTPMTFFSMIGLAVCPILADWTRTALGMAPAVGGSSGGADVLTLWYFAFFYFLFELACITSLTLFGALVNDVVPRAIIGRFYGAFRAVSLGAGIVFSAFLLRWAESHFTQVFLGIGIVFGLGFMLMCLFVKEGEYAPPPPPPANARTGLEGWIDGVANATKTYIRDCFALSYYRWVFAAMLLAGLTFQPFNNFRVVYAKAVGVDLGVYGYTEATSFTLSFLIAYPLGMLVDRYHPLRMGIISMAIYSLVTVCGSFLIVGPKSFLAVFMAHTILSGVFFTSTAALAAVLFPKVTFGQFVAAAATIAHIGAMVLAAIYGYVLDKSGNEYRILWMMGLLLSLASIACLLVVYAKFNRLGGQTAYTAPTT